MKLGYIEQGSCYYAFNLKLSLNHGQQTLPLLGKSSVSVSAKTPKLKQQQGCARLGFYLKPSPNWIFWFSFYFLTVTKPFNLEFG